MAKKSDKKQKLLSKDELIRELAASRDRMAADFGRLSSKLDVKRTIEVSLRRNAKSWLALAAVAGLTMVVLPSKRSRKKETRRLSVASKMSDEQASVGGTAKRGGAHWVFQLLKFLLTVVKPIILAFATRQASAMASRILPAK